LFDAVAEDGGDVIGVAEPVCGDESWQECLGIVVVGFGTAQFRVRGPKCVGLDRALGLIAGQSGAADEGGSAVVLGCGSQGFVFDGELGDQAPLVLFGDDGFVGG